jgi:hypothetical protein
MVHIECNKRQERSWSTDNNIKMQIEVL